MTKFARLIFFPLILASVRLGAQVASPSPLTDGTAVAATVPGGWIVAEGRANNALQAGFPTTAAVSYRELLRAPALPVEAKQRITLALVTALMDAGEIAEADKYVQAYDGPRNSSYHLRVGLLAANSRRMVQAKAALATVKVEELSSEEKGWWYFLQALVAEDENDLNRRNTAYQQANAVAVSDLQRVRFMLAQEQARLRRAPADESRLPVLRQTIEDYQGRTMGYESALTYAAALAGLGRSSEAQTVLQRQLAIIPGSERNQADQFRLLLGLIAGESSVPGRQAFKQLLRDGQKPETQRIALSLLVRGAKSPVEREQLRRDLSDLIGAPVQHPIIENLLLARAQAALADKAYAAAEEDARALLERYPGSTLKAAALGVRLSVAWEDKRYRMAADVITQLRPLMVDGRERAELGVLLAEAFFRAEDYRNAADAYDAALRELPVVVPAGKLIFQRVLSDIRADQLPAAAKVLDESAANQAFDPESRWQAEWNLMKAMQVRGQTQAASARVDRLLAAGTQGVSEDLRIRLLWLQAKLSFDSNRPDTSLRQADELLAVLQREPQLDAVLRTNVTSLVQLLKAQAQLMLNRDKEGFAVLEKLRAEFPNSAAAQYSFLVEAGYLSGKGDMVGAQGVFIRFVDNPLYKSSEYAPLALYEAALNLERQGLDRQLREAYEKMLERLVKDYPQSDLVFYARLKQGDLMRKLNDFATARQLYEDLVNNYPGHPDELTAQLELADCLFAMGANNVVNHERAATIFERLRDLASAPVDLRVEAGFKWGMATAKRSQVAGTPAERDQQIAKAQIVFWSVIDTFLLDPAQADKLGAKGRYWVSRSLLELGQIHEDAGNHDEAQRAYQLIVDNKLGGQALALAKLARYRTPGVAKP